VTHSPETPPKAPPAPPSLVGALAALVLLQDLDRMIHDAADPLHSEEVSRMGFRVEGLPELRAAREEVAAGLDRSALRLYDAVAKRYAGTTVVPVRNRTCLGCSAVQPRSFVPDRGKPSTCQSCGRILVPL
jgi:predicted  nucleic acid-binding Zn-ribbon protein